MPDSNKPDDNNSPERGPDIAWRREQLRKAEMAMRGMQSGSFGNGNGEFIEPVIVNGYETPNYPELNSIISAATGSIDVGIGQEVSGNLPELDKSIQESYEQSDGWEPPVPKLSEPAEPASDQRLFGLDSGGYSSKSFASELPVTSTAPQSKPVLSNQDVQNLQKTWPPGIGRGVKSPEERARIIEASQQLKQQQGTRKQQREAARQGGSSGGSLGSSDIEVDENAVGSTARINPTTSQVGIHEAAAKAVESIDNSSELMIILLQRIVATQIRNGEKLKSLLDKVDAEDDADEF